MTEPLIHASRPSTSTDPLQQITQEADRPGYFGVNGISEAEADLDTPPATPRWVKWFGVAAVVLVLVFAGMHLMGLTPMHDTPMHGVQLP